MNQEQINKLLRNGKTIAGVVCFVFAALLITGALPVADGMDLMSAVTVAAGAGLALSVVDHAETRLAVQKAVDALQKIDFESDLIDMAVDVASDVIKASDELETVAENTVVMTPGG